MVTESERENLERAKRIRDRLADAGLLPEPVLSDNPSRTSRSRYFQRGNGPMFSWTTERFEGKFVSMVHRPVGNGAQSGKASEWQLVMSGKWKPVKHAKRKDAKARALRLYEQEAGR